MQPGSLRYALMLTASAHARFPDRLAAFPVPGGVSGGVSSPARPAQVDGPCSTAVPAPLPDAWRMLDERAEWDAFSRPVTGDAACLQSSVVISGMHCAACAISIEQALRAIPGVARAEVSAASGRARIVWSPERVKPSGWVQAIHRLGYSVLPANDEQALVQRRSESRKALWRWLVAGLCMMQVMMYAYPAYIAEPGDLSAEMEHLLRWASWVLTLPVMLFSCGPFFRSALRDIAQRRIGMDLPVALGVAITFAVSSAGTFNPQGIFGREVFFDSLTMFVFFLLTGRWLELRLRDRTAGALEAAMNRMPDVVERQRTDGSFEAVAPRRLLAGDVVRILPGQAFPADGEIVLGETRVDQSLLTGESKAVARGTGATVVAGSYNLSSPVQVRVERTGEQTRFAQIVALMQSAATSKPRMALLADRLAKPFLLAVLLAAAGAAAFWWSRDPGHALMVAVAVLVVTCPCALSLATPAAMLASAGSLARAGVLVRRLQGLETLARIDDLVFDKTGTLTSEVLQVSVAAVREGLVADDVLALAGALARQSLHPVARAIAQAAGAARTAPAAAAAAAAAATTSTASATVPSTAPDSAPAPPTVWATEDVREHAGRGLEGQVGRPDGSIASRHVRLGSARFCGLAAGDAGQSRTFLCDERGWLATFELDQHIRADAHATVRSLQQSGLTVHLLSGDEAGAASRVAAQLGITAVRSACTPDDKLAYLYRLRAQGRRIAMVGDGLNDAPVLAAADVSFAFGPAVPLLQSQADFVLPGVCLAPVVQTLLLARRTMRIVRQNLCWALVYNLACVPLAVLGLLPAWLAGLGMAASSLLVVLNALRLSGRMGSRGLGSSLHKLSPEMR